MIWSLSFHMMGNALIWCFISHWGAIYWAIVKHRRRRTLESKDIIEKLCPNLICLSLHPFVLEATISALSQACFYLFLSFLCLEDWSGGGPGGGTRFLNFDEMPTKVVICISIYINRNIHFSSIISIIVNICIYGCNYFVYMLELNMLD